MDVKKIEEKYSRLPHPVVVSGTDGAIVYLNDAAKKSLKSAKKNLNIAVMLEKPELAVLRETVSAGMASAMDFKLPGNDEYAGGLAIPENIDGGEYITFFFVPPFDLLGGTRDYDIEIKRILDFYNREKSVWLTNALFGNKDGSLKNTCESYKKVARIDKYINYCMQRMLDDGRVDDLKQIRDITADLKLLKEVFDKYIIAQGYRIRYVLDDNWFYTEYNEWDFLVVNAIGASFALRNSEDRKIDFIFKNDSTGAASIEIAFTPPEIIFDYFTNNISMNIAETGYAAINNSEADVNYFDLYLAHTVAAKNRMNFYLDSEGKKIKFVLKLGKSQFIAPDAGFRASTAPREKYGEMIAAFLMLDFD